MLYVLQGLMKRFSGGFLISVSLSATDLVCLIKILIFNSDSSKCPPLLAILMIWNHLVIQSLKSGKTRRSGLVSILKQENLRIYSWYSLQDSKHGQRCFIRISSLNLPEMRALLIQFYQTVIMETTTVTKILTLVLAIYTQVF